MTVPDFYNGVLARPSEGERSRLVHNECAERNGWLFRERNVITDAKRRPRCVICRGEVKQANNRAAGGA